MYHIAANIAHIREAIGKAAKRVGRDPCSVELIAVTKTVDVACAVAALDAGVESLGESRVQEARRKRENIGRKARWHMIGPLQVNKAKYCPGLFYLVHSVDRLELMQQLSRRSVSAGTIVECLLQINVSGEKQKSGCDPIDAVDLLKKAAGFPGIRIRGLMTIPPYAEDPENSRPYYKELCNLKNRFERMDIEAVSMKDLSMGMSGDFEIAVEEGATMVRVGSAIFGPKC